MRSRPASVLVAAVGVLAALIPASPARAALAQPALLGPSGTASGTPTLTWARVDGATSYVVQTARDAGFTTDLVSRTTVNRRYVPTTVFKTGPVWWRVQARGGGTTSAFATAAFTSTPTAAPVPTSPATTSVLTWTPVQGAAGYTVEVDGQPTTLRNTTFVAPAGTHTWRVRATYAGGADSDWSAAQVYGTALLPAPVLTTPEQESEAVVLHWEPVLGATGYDVELNGSVTTTNVTSFDPGPLDAGDWVWRVRATGGDWSGTRSFSIAWDDAPELLPPSQDPLRFQWSALGLADSYTLTITDGAHTDVCTTRRTSYTPRDASDCWPTAPGTWTWRVVAHSTASGLSSATAEDTFEYAPEPFQPVAPTDGQLVDVPALTWEPMSGAARYRLNVWRTNTASKPVQDRTINGTSYVHTTKLTIGATYSWNVQPLNDGRVGALPPFDEWPTFTVVPMGWPDADEPTPLEPDDGSVHRRFPLLEWEPILGATGYDVVLPTTTIPNATPGDVFPYPAGTYWNAAAPLGEVEWHVVAHTPGGDVAGPSRSFTIVPPPAPENLRASGCTDEVCEFTRTPSLRWDPVPDASHYRVTIGAVAIETESTRYTPPALLPDGSHAWSVEACITTCGPSATRTFTKTTPTVTPTAPGSWPAMPGASGYRVQVATDSEFANVVDTTDTRLNEYDGAYPLGTLYQRVAWRDGSGNLSQYGDSIGFEKTLAAPVLGPRFTWQPVLHATAYDVEVSPGLTATTARTAYAPTDPLPPGPHTWRVRAVSASGDRGPWSDSEDFTEITNAPVLQTPDPGEHVPADDSLFSWHPVVGAKTYRFERRRLGAAALTESTATAALSWAPVSYLGDTMWEWRMVALDAADHELGASGWRQFVVDTTRPIVLGRKPAAAKVKPGVTFTVTFSEPVSGITTKSVRLIRNGKVARARVTLSTDGLRAVLDPRRKLTRGATYKLQVRGSITDLHRLPLIPKTWKITVKG